MVFLGRLFYLVAGIFLMSLGVSLTIISGLGTTPISSLPMSLAAITGSTVGIITIILNAIFILIQIALLRRRYRPVQLLQIFTALLFGSLIDATGLGLEALGVEANNYWQSWLLVLIGTLIMGVGVGLQVHANLINLPGEGLVLAVTAELRRIFGPREGLNFGRVKTVNDIVYVVLAVLLSLVFLGTVVGVREGTVFSALTLGYISQATLKALKGRVEKPAKKD